MNEVLLSIVIFIFGIFFGYIAGIFKETGSYRKEIYDRKFKANTDIFEKGLDVYFSSVAVMNKIPDEQEKLDEYRSDFFDSIMRNSIVFSPEIVEFSMKLFHSTDQKKPEDFKGQTQAFVKFVGAIKKDLKIKEIHGLTTALLSPQEFLSGVVKEKLSLLKKRKNKGS